MKEFDESWKVRWSGEGIGRFWKRQLAKARRRYIKAVLRGEKGKYPFRYERECNWKGT
jgi:hypothetical protein